MKTKSCLLSKTGFLTFVGIVILTFFQGHGALLLPRVNEEEVVAGIHKAMENMMKKHFRSKSNLDIILKFHQNYLSKRIGKMQSHLDLTPILVAMLQKRCRNL